MNHGRRHRPPLGPVAIGTGDPRYADLVNGVNHRFTGTPEHIRVVGDAEQTVRAVQDAVDAGLRVAVRSGGHCLEDFVDGPDTRFLIDMSQMDTVYHDPVQGAFAVEPGIQLGALYRALYKGWNVTVPGGSCPTVAAGGHILGGGYGPLTRLHGCVVDYLHAVEVVVVDAAGTARRVVASRDDEGALGDLWWAHTGGGGGTFGVVTRYWLRARDAPAGAAPGTLLPRPPATVLDSLVTWSWQDMTGDRFRRLMRNHAEWHERNSAPDSRYAGLFSVLGVMHSASGVIVMSTQTDATVPDAEALLQGYVDALAEGTGPHPAHLVRRRPWLRSMLQPTLPDTVTGMRSKGKAAYLLKGYDDEQLDVLHRALTDADHGHPGAGVLFMSYGGRVAEVPAHATATAQRGAVMKAFYVDLWQDPAEDARHLAWIRELYRDVYARTGGVPVPDGQSDGTYINYPDTDLADPEWNKSPVPWHALYYKDNYPRLQRAKAHWDPRDVFRHALSVRLPEA
ncbi:FAD-binding protein [Streptomyces fuscichromogenes]|uniref:FAD-linked oxidase n=1 Tax=Streptomyces fuscichromogenes TaxID=1324013 RepID=A0A917XK49_9ACTN|nr:FAD-binding protein [Streptomyces fuscichromogenes]GGN33623.1 FAD-linked oxidase [Streptomyces fuscichromogenes]